MLLLCSISDLIHHYADFVWGRGLIQLTLGLSKKKAEKKKENFSKGKQSNISLQNLQGYSDLQ